MKTVEELKKEQCDAKAKLYELMEFINSEEYYTLTPSEKNIIGQRRMALEMYLNSLSKNIYDKEGSAFDLSGAMWPLMMSSMFSSSSFGSFSGTDYLKKKLEEEGHKTEADDSQEESVYAIPV
jgi:hypothetical protein